ncbi:MAG: LysR family transcriptional regulator [Comamonas sp.]|uniref:LysR family transcriptional regulator n=1 Tax=Comamonas sp. TaxID=34028 RepID=UPI003D0EB89F
MDTEGLKLFLTVLEQGSLTRAAAVMDTSASLLSRRIAQLERECAGSLFHRTGRGVVPSELGRRLVPRAQRILAEAEGMRAEAQSMAGIPSGEVRLGLLPTVAMVIANQLFHEVKSRFPQVKLALYEGYTGQLEEWLDQGKIDVAVVFHYGKGVPQNQDLLAPVDACLIACHGDPLTSSAQLPFDSLDCLPLVLPSAPSALRVALEALAHRRRIRLNPVIEANSIQVQLQLVASGGCYTIIPFHAVVPQLQNGQLQASVITRPSIERWLTLQLTTQRPSTLATREVARALRGIVEDLAEQGAWGTTGRENT